jgi:hypothetical protein
VEDSQGEPELGQGTLGGATPNDFYCRDVPEPVPHDAKVVPPKIERRRFAETRVTGFRLLRAA